MNLANRPKCLRVGFWYGWVGCGVLFLGALAWAEDASLRAKARILRPVGQLQVKNLTFSSDEFLIEEKKEPKPSLSIVLEGEVKGASLVRDAQNRKFSTNTQGKFRVRQFLTEPLTEVKWTIVLSNGLVLSETFQIIAPKERFKGFLPKNPSQPSVDARNEKGAALQLFSIGLGYSYLTYKELSTKTNLGINYRQNAITLKGGVRYPLSARWSAGLSGYLNLLPFGSTLGSKYARFLGVNMRIGYLLPFSNPRLNFMLMGGAYYTTMLVSTPHPPYDSFGFQNLIGPQIYPTLQWVVNPRRILSFYAKYSPITGGSEMAAGVEWGTVLNNGHRLPVALDVSSVRLRDPDSAVNPLSIQLNTVSFSLGYSL